MVVDAVVETEPQAPTATGERGGPPTAGRFDCAAAKRPAEEGVGGGAFESAGVDKASVGLSAEAGVRGGLSGVWGCEGLSLSGVWTSESL